MLAATLLAAAVWTAPTPLELPDYGATASGAFGGSAIGGDFEATRQGRAARRRRARRRSRRSPRRGAARVRSVRRGSPTPARRSC